MVTQYAFLINSDACSGCKTCQVACKDHNDLTPGVHWRVVYEVTGGEWLHEDGAWRSSVAAYNLSASCHHCWDPACVPACTVEAIWKRADGIVLIDESRCNRCHKCEPACPYGAIRFDMSANIVGKCHFCFDYIDAGLPPACVAACPNRALDYGDHAVLTRKYGDLNQVFPLPDAPAARPAIIIIPHRNLASLAGRRLEVANLEET
jgi:anaerobic dimethyl sulfoxide reductase subunit B (iron-sulfur subunit)